MACRWKGGGEQPDHRVRQFTIEQRRSGESDGWVAAAVSPMSIGACVTAEAVANGIKCYLSETGVFGCEIVRLQSAHEQPAVQAQRGGTAGQSRAWGGGPTGAPAGAEHRMA